MSILENLEPKGVFRFFEELCAIPHGSTNTKQVSDWLMGFARERSLEAYQDQLNNVIIIKEATPGYENAQPVILQGHMDMVCEKAPDCAKDMEKEGLDLVVEGDTVYARGTTLGGDDGIAAAMALALLADNTIPYPPLEVVMTTEEEIGLLGADAIDLSQLKGRTLINLDSETEGVFTVSCAGGCTACITLPVERRAIYGPCIRLSVDGLKGGHSGADIHLKRANADKVMGLFMSRIQEIMPLCLTSLSGGAKDNAIPRSCQATLVAMGINLERINDIAAALQEEIRANYDEPDATVQAFDVDALGGNSLSTESTAKVISLLCSAPNGVQKWSADIEGLVQTSLNLGIVKLGDRFSATFSVRSSVNAEKTALIERLAETGRQYGAAYSESGAYPAWEYRRQSPLRDVMVACYERLYGKKPVVEAIHAGLECGIFSDRLKGLDAVSFGPQMHDIHTTRERLDIASTRRTWDFLLAVLAAL